MTGEYAQRYAEWLTAHSKAVIVSVLLVTVLVGAGGFVGESADGGIGEFEVDSPEFEAAEFVRNNYAGNDQVVAQVVVREREGTVLTRDSLLAGLRLQESIRNDEAIAATLSETGLIGFENLVGTAAVVEDARQAGEQPPAGFPSVEDQRAALEARDEAAVDALVERLLDPERDAPLPDDADPAQFLPASYEPGDTMAPARLTLISQVDDSAEGEDPVAAYEAQVAIDRLVDEQFDDAFVFGQGISNEASANATGDSFAIITPFALVLVLFVLGISYRDVADIVLAILSIVLVLVWLQGVMGWLEIPMNVILIAVPFLLIGLSIDYALHVVMRYREARSGTLDADIRRAKDAKGTDVVTRPGVRAGMALGLGSVVLALAAATFSTGVGFLSNVVSPLPAIQDFAVLSGAGIFATFVAFGVFLPALKLEVDTVLEERFGRARDKAAFGASGGGANRLLSAIAAAVSRAPLVVLLLALVLSLGGAYGATTLDTEFNEADFLPEDAPSWAQYLPGPFQPGSYTISDDFAYLSENFRLGGDRGQSTVLLRGDVTDPAVLAAVDDATNDVSADSAIQLRPDGTGAVEGPHTAIRAVAATNETFAVAVDDADTTGDGLPNENVEHIYAELFAADEDAAAAVLSRSDGEITSARLLLSVRGDQSAQRIASDTRAFAGTIEAGAGGVDFTATATGQTVTTAVLQDALLDTLIDAFAVTLVVILLFLTVLFWVQYRSPTQGVVIVLPVVAALAWLLGVMALLDINLNSETAVITSLAIGLGVDYSIHAGERFVAERDRQETLEEALEATITGTGGALLASAATTAGGFGVLALALAPPLQRFGIVTGTAIVFAFVAVLTILPCLLVVRERLLARLAGTRT